MDLNLVQGNVSDNLGPNGSDKVSVSENGDQTIEHELMLDGNVNLGPDCFDKISISANGKQNTEQKLMLDNNVNVETKMEWTIVRPKNKRTRSNANESEKISLETAKSPSKKQKSARPKNKPL